MSPDYSLKSYGCFLTHWLTMVSILLKIQRICNSQFKCNYLKNEKLFLTFLFHFWNLHQILHIFIKKMMVIPNVFPKLQTWKNFVRPFCKKRRFGTRSSSQDVKMCQSLAKSPWECFFHIFSSFWGKFSLKMSPLDVGEILGAFVNTMTADGKYHVQYRENLPLSIQMQLSEKRKTSFECFVPLLESTSNFKYSEIKYDGHS